MMSKKEIETLLRYRLKVDLFRQWLGEFKDIAHVLDTLNATVEGTEGLNAGTPVAMEFCTIDGLREQIRKMRKEAADHIATLETESAANWQRALVAENLRRDYEGRMEYVRRLCIEMNPSLAPDTSTQSTDQQNVSINGRNIDTSEKT